VRVNPGSSDSRKGMDDLTLCGYNVGLPNQAEQHDSQENQ
jgi:hypothetical protein